MGIFILQFPNGNDIITYDRKKEKNMPMKGKEWITKVKKLMEEKGISQKELSEKSGIAPSSVSRYLNGEREPRIDVMINFSKALNVDVETLLDSDRVTMTPYESIKYAIARNGNNLTADEQKELVDLLLGKDK